MEGYQMTYLDILEHVMQFYQTHTADEIHEVWDEVEKEHLSDNPPTVTEYKQFLETIDEQNGRKHSNTEHMEGQERSLE